MSQADDAELARVRGGDPDALGAFVQRHRRQLLAYIEGNMSAALRRKVEPEDVLQEVTISALRALADTDLTERDPFLWLCQLCHRRIIDTHRKLIAAGKRAADLEVPLQADAGRSSQGGLINLLAASLTTPSQAFSRDQRHRRLNDAIASLPAEAREVLRLRYVENLPSKEIAERLGKTDAAVRTLLTRCLRRLETILGTEADPGKRS
jgi:RNA polymerase sigma-70 factor (ECF subfamily)